MSGSASASSRSAENSRPRLAGLTGSTTDSSAGAGNWRVTRPGMASPTQPPVRAEPIPRNRTTSPGRATLAGAQPRGVDRSREVITSGLASAAPTRSLTRSSPPNMRQCASVP